MVTKLLPYTYYTAEQTRTLDRLAIQREGIPGFELMRRAAAASFTLFRRLWPVSKHVLFFAGAGNNAGDAYLFAELAHRSSCKVVLYYLKEPNQLSGDALKAAQSAEVVGVDIRPFADVAEVDWAVWEIVVDGLLGTGFSGALKPDFRQAIELMNSCGRPILAIDIPSGLSADTGVVSDIAVNCQATVTFIGLKRGQFTAMGPNYCGELWFDDLNVPESVYQTFDSEPICHGVDLNRVQSCLPSRRATDHKGRFGHLLAVGGNVGFLGAAVMAATTALRTGTGLVSLATRAEHAALATVYQPEIMARPVESKEELTQLLDRSNSVVIGPGLGQDAWAETVLDAVATSGLPLVVDADALNIISARNLQHKFIKYQQQGGEPNAIFTPHPGEAARLLECTVAEIQGNRFKAAEAIAEKYGAIVVLKGAGTLVAEPSSPQIYLNRTGNPGMASGGMGDVLAGLIGSFLAQGLSAHEAAKMAVMLHGLAADLEVERAGMVGMLATDLISVLREVINEQQ